MAISVELVRDNLRAILDRKTARLAKLRELYKDAQDENDIGAMEDLEIKINDLLFNITILQSKINYMRKPYIEDMEERKDIKLNYNEKIKKTIREDVPMVFHGVSYLGVVEEILKSGGLFTLEERNMSIRSLANQIDVTQRGRIQTTLEFADPPGYYTLPYGAIFALMPLKEEEHKVLHTKEGSEVPGGIESINFREHPERLISIITTSENIDLIRSWCEKYMIDPNLVLTHEQFLELCKEKYSGVEQSK